MYNYLAFLDEVIDVGGSESGVNVFVIILIAVIVIAAGVLIARAIMKKKRG
ncbi:MAG: hypothetical protein K6E85_04700 [Lachnospiraceae bacterium]|nr:hypothetical protein [Lachnospiraceae bacterium]